MDRAPHYLRPSKHVGYPRRQVVVAVEWERVETISGSGQARDILSRWYAVSWDGGPGEETWRNYGEGTTADSWWTWLDGELQRRVCPWIWALGMCHALTLLEFWQLLERGEWYLSLKDTTDVRGDVGEHGTKGGSLCVTEDPPTIILAFRTDGRTSAKFLDVRNLGMGETGVSGRTSEQPTSLATWLQEWCRTVEHLRLGGLRHTAAAQSWHGWRHSYLDEGILIHGNDDAFDLERRSIYPGRAEAFRIGRVEATVYGVDASAHYPSCATAGQLPIRLRWHGACDLGQLERCIGRGWAAIALCRVTTASNILPARSSEGTIWPVGTWIGAYCWPEISGALASGLSVRVMRASLYETGRPAHRFMSALWRERELAALAGLTARRECIKLLMNSLVGKWAARRREWIDAPEALPPAPWYSWHRNAGADGKLKRHRSLGWHCQYLEIGDYTQECCPALASWTYSVGRMRLWEWMQTAGMEDVYYVDSDSLYTSSAGYGRLASGGALKPATMGALRLQSVSQGIWIGGIKQYRTDSRSVCAGVPSGDVQESSGEITYWRPSRVNEAVSERRSPDNTAALIRLQVHRPYRHGVVCADGRILPLTKEE